MWLINVRSMTLESVADPSTVRFATLSHTWEHEEVSFQDFVANREKARLMAGYQKVEMVCELARAQGLDFAWIDTCCIDKTSSAELSEAINSMFQWYRGSAACFVYLSDLRDPTPPAAGAAAGPGSHRGPPDLLRRLRACRWFARGWTLQELIAPTSVEFFDARWREVGTKASLVEPLSEITTIPQSVLLDSSVMYGMPVGRRMSWAAHRTTTRIEDRAYSIIGIFDINMPMLYGEGDKAFIRLQEEIVKETNDLSLFAWVEAQAARPSRYRGLFAKSPDEFESCQTLETSETSVVKELDFSITNNGVRFETTLWIDAGRGFTMNLNCVKAKAADQDRPLFLGIYLERTSSGFIRKFPRWLYQTPSRENWYGPREPVYVRKRLTDAESQNQGLAGSHPLVGVRPTQHVVIVSAAPASLWNGHTRSFLTNDRADFTGCVRLSVTVPVEKRSKIRPRTPVAQDLDIAVVFGTTLSGPADAGPVYWADVFLLEAGKGLFKASDTVSWVVENADTIGEDAMLLHLRRRALLDKEFCISRRDGLTTAVGLNRASIEELQRDGVPLVRVEGRRSTIVSRLFDDEYVRGQVEFTLSFETPTPRCDAGRCGQHGMLRWV